MQFIIVLMILFSLWVSAAPLVHPDDSVNPVPANLGNAVIPSGNSNESAGNLLREGVSAVVQETGLENPLPTINRTVKETVRSVGKSLGQYLRGQYQHMKNQDILARFDQALNEHLSGLPLTSDERSLMVRKIEQAYIEDGESGRNELDQTNFRDLANLVRKEYSEIILSRSREGEVGTYDLKGNIKTRWNLKGGRLHGPATSYYPSGEIKFIDIYEHGQKVSRKKYDEEGQLVFEQTYSYEKTKEPVKDSVAASEPDANDFEEENVQPAQANPSASKAAIRRIPVTGSDDTAQAMKTDDFDQRFQEALKQTTPDAHARKIPIIFADSQPPPPPAPQN